MEISIKDFDPQENKEQARPKKPRKRIDPTFGVIIRILICFALIDIPIWSYFHFVKGVSVWEGLQQIRGNVQTEINPPRKDEFKVTRKNFEAENATKTILQDVQPRNRGQSQDIYIWNENGRIRASNINQPKDNDDYQVIKGITPSTRETKYTQKGGSILLPVIIGNNGKSYKVNMILDTGCTITLLDAEISAALNFQTTGTIISSIADGSKLLKKTGNMDYIQVGPFREDNFFLSTAFIQGNQKTNYGLLGMNFLEKHPFTIDHRRNVIVWQ